MIAALVALAGCGGDDDAPPGNDAGQTDSGAPDASAPDSGAPDGGATDSGQSDAGTDAGTDAGLLDPAPAYRNPVDLADGELAQQALRILGAPEAGGSGSCAGCHGITRSRVTHWQWLSDQASATCLVDLEVRSVEAANAVVECLRGGPEGDEYTARRLGIHASAARLEWFPFVFERALGDDWSGAYGEFADQAGMPIEPETHAPLTQSQFDIVAEWYARGLPALDSVLPPDPPPTVCEGSVSPDVAEHVAEMAEEGWAALNRENGLLMYGCAGAATPLQCLANKPRARDTAFGATWEVPGSTLRVLTSYNDRSSFWTRSSADGRFVAMGGGPSNTGSSTFIDLQTNRIIGANAAYDPAFFPDNSGFVFQGGGAHFCEQSVLTIGNPTTITFNEPQCETNSAVGLYEHVGASLGGGDYWAVHGQFVSDDGWGGGDPSSSWPDHTLVELTRLVNDGSGFSPRETLTSVTAYEGDAVISPSSRLMLTRVGASGGQLGFALRRVNATRSPGGTWSLETPVVGRYCINGGKPAFSFDERFMVVHHYESNHADVWLVDLVTGSQTRITNMGAGQLALFPHFRSDGWIYFIVRGAPGGEHVVASDAALVAAQ